MFWGISLICLLSTTFRGVDGAMSTDAGPSDDETDEDAMESSLRAHTMLDQMLYPYAAYVGQSVAYVTYNQSSVNGVSVGR